MIKINYILHFEESIMKKRIILPILLMFFSAVTSFAGEADVVEVKVDRNTKNLFDFIVTVRHADTGWNHYADKWDIVDEKGIILGSRVLHHPHVEEQPFSRNLSGVKIPVRLKHVTVRAHDSVHEYGGKVMIVELP